MESTHQADHSGPARVLERFLLAAPEQWPVLAPRLVAGVGEERLRGVLTATRERVGGFTSVTEGPEGLVIAGPRGRVLAFARADAEGELVGLLIAPGLHRPARRRVPLPARVRGAVFRTVLCATLALRVAACWRAPTMVAWCTAVSVIGIGALLLTGLFAPARLPRWARRTAWAALAVTLASFWRLPRLPVGRPDPYFVAGLVLFAGCAGYLVWARRHDWGAPVSAPLEFPLRDGAWLIVHGGGPGLNHHASHPEQRGALDIIGVTARGSRREDGAGLDSYAIYGATLYAPCDGVVVSAVDGLDDQIPGTIRYVPPYGNHVSLDTGHEIVTMAHLRPGSVAVSVGERVRVGRVVGAVGNSGNSTEPHLHVQAVREGVGLDLRFRGVPGPLYRGRTVHT
ncbi:M23 family metallopeptidase [Streptomyces sp. NPDC006660]|uniref:M23 family metallopeptidase n=1 Tax=Streptomyces sp. NPDC006660 TaxID=3156901 RepID=UPI0033E05FC5